jgi:hypothetical protein
MKTMAVQLAIVAAAAGIAGCGTPGVGGLRDSFAQQLAANEFVKDFHRRGDDLTFSGPSITGRTARWRVHIDSAVIAPTDNPVQPYKGTVKSSWYADDQAVRPSGIDSNLPLELTDNGLAQDCWAMWDRTAKRWSWE